LTILATLVVIGVLVFVHEFGHFVAAKLAGIYVHRFSLGLGGPIRWLSFRRGETEYAVSWLPLGGYVKMASNMEDPASMSLEGRADGAGVPPDRVFEAKPVWLRMIVILAGVAMNVLFGWIVYTGISLGYGVPELPVTRVARVDTVALPAGARSLSAVRSDRIVRVAGIAVDSWDAMQRAWLAAPTDTFSVELSGAGTLAVNLPTPEERRQALRALEPDLPAVIADVVSGRPGAKAGLAAGDTILAFNGEPVTLWTDLVDRIAPRAGQEIELLIGREGGRLTVRATPAAETQTDSAGVARTVGRLWITGPLTPERRVPVPFGKAVADGARRTALVSTLIVSTVRGLLTGAVPTRELGGPISIGVMAGESARRGGEAFLSFMAFISVNLAILNLLPIPVLDGGQFLFLLAEAVTRRPVTGKVREWLGLAGLVVIVLLMILAFSNDIRRLLGV
jgi:regulator of sigma E protease